ncbi:MAG: nucleotidyltransferase domain-containing protein [Dehalococcoidia bacterium]
MVSILDGLNVPWWIAGGYAIDAFAWSGRREHDDIDVSLFHGDQKAAHEHFGEWELHCADPPGTLRPWRDGESLGPEIHDIWARRNSADAWRFQLMLNPGGPGDLVYRRDPRISWPIDEATFVKDGVRYLAPEIQLLFKSRRPRPKDEQDFADCLPLLSASQRAWLAETLREQSPGHAWLGRL